MSSEIVVTKSPFTKDCLSGKIALVTGGGSGICFEITRQLLLHGCSGAVICGRREEFLKRSSKVLCSDTGKDCSYKVCDVRDPVACENAVQYTVQRYGKVDILINGAAGNFLVEANKLSPKGFATVMSIDTNGTFNMSRYAYDAFTSNSSSSNSNSNTGDDNGIIINISATLQYGATHWVSHASAAKAAVDSLTRSLALEWGCDKIRVNGIAPGPIADTPGTTKLAPGMTTADAEEMVQDGIPLGRMGRSDEIGLAAVYLCASKYVTGHTLVVDGGEYLYRPPLVPREMVSELSRNVEAKSRAQKPSIRSKL